MAIKNCSYISVFLTHRFIKLLLIHDGVSSLPLHVCSLWYASLLSRYEAIIFMAAMETLRSKPDVFGVPSSTVNAGASFRNLMQLRDCGGMATVFTANQVIGGPESTATRPVVLKRSDKDQPGAYLRESRILQYLSRVAAGSVVQLLEAYSTPEHNLIAMELGGQNLTARVQELTKLPPSERNTQLALWGQQACQVNAMAYRSCDAISPLICRRERRGHHKYKYMFCFGDRYALFSPISKRERPCGGKHSFTLRGIGLFQVLVALHGLGVVWGDVKPDNYVFRGDRLVAVDFGSTCVEVGSIAQRELGAAADTSFTSRPSDQFAWSVQYGAPERARSDRRGEPCVARRSQVKGKEIPNCGTRSILNFSHHFFPLTRPVD